MLVSQEVIKFVAAILTLHEIFNTNTLTSLCIFITAVDIFYYLNEIPIVRRACKHDFLESPKQVSKRQTRKYFI